MKMSMKMIINEISESNDNEIKDEDKDEDKDEENDANEEIKEEDTLKEEEKKDEESKIIGATNEHIEKYFDNEINYDKISEGKTLLTDGEGNAIMMKWETPIMKKSAEIITKQKKGLRILNIGFGLGIIDTFIQEYEPKKHVIIEAHEGVYNKMIKDGWKEKKGVEIHFGKWQDIIPQLTETFDGIYFDTWGEDYTDMKEFHEHLLNILDQETGGHSFFNGLAATSVFFHDVACRIVECDIQELAMHIEFQEFAVDLPPEAAWEGINRKYFTLSKYRLPVISFGF